MRIVALIAILGLAPSLPPCPDLRRLSRRLPPVHYPMSPREFLSVWAEEHR